MKLVYVILSILSLTLLGCKSNEQTVLTRTDYSISYNKSYAMDDSGVNGTDFYIVLSRDKNTNFRNNINLLVQDLTETNIDLTKFVDLTESQIRSSGQLIKSERINRNGKEYQSILFEADFGQGLLRFLQYDFMLNNKAYILTYTATISTFEENLSKAQKVMDSFKLNHTEKL